MKQKRLTFLLLLISNLFCASAQKWYKPEIDLKVEELLSQMTVEEKLGYIGGIDWMYTKSIDRLGIHRMRMDRHKRQVYRIPGYSDTSSYLERESCLSIRKSFGT